MIWDTADRPNLLACAQMLEAEGFNVQVTPLQFCGTSYYTVCALGEVEEHLLWMVVENEDAGSSINPEELVANAQTLSAKNEEVHQRKMVASVKRVCDLMQDGDVRSAICAAGYRDRGYWDVLPKVVAIALQQSKQYDLEYL